MERLHIRSSALAMMLGHGIAEGVGLAARGSEAGVRFAGAAEA